MTNDLLPFSLNPIDLLRPRRQISGISATLLPFTEQGQMDWAGFCAHVDRTAQAGLMPAVNMDTGYVNLLDAATRLEVLQRTRETLAGKSFVAGAFIADQLGDPWNPAAYARQIELIQQHGGTPIIFQSYGLAQQPGEQIVAAYIELGHYAPQFIAIELGQMFAPFGQIYDQATYEGLLGVPQCVAAKHSSLNRTLEWQRLQARDRLRPDFKLYTGNDLAIDMVMYGSDYLLGLSSFAPDIFSKRDAMWASGDSDFYQLNDVLQYLGFFAFRVPVPAYKHTAAMFLHLRKWISTSLTHPASPERPESDVPILEEIFEKLRPWM